MPIHRCGIIAHEYVTVMLSQSPQASSALCWREASDLKRINPNKAEFGHLRFGSDRAPSKILLRKFS